MNTVSRTWRSLWFGRKLAKKGRRIRFFGTHYQFEGHIEIGDYCRFRDSVILRTEGSGRIVFNTYSGAANYVIIEATDRVEIGSMTWVSEFAVIRDTTHLVHGTTEHWRYTPHIAMPVSIGDNCWIGSRAYIGPGVTVGEGAVIGAGSVVKEQETIEPYEIWAGVPARRIGSRRDDVPPDRKAYYESLLAQYGVRENRYDLSNSA